MRLPNIGIPAITGNTIEPKNKIQFNAIGDSPIAYDSTDNAILLAESFENYCLNFESVLLSQPQYQSSTNRSVAERVFFKWLKEIGAIRFRNANISEVSPTMTGTKFVELDETYDTNTNLTYNRVVKYVNNITAVHANTQGSVYTEIYIYTPSNHGYTPYVLFDSLSDNNYQQNKIYQNTVNAANIELIVGRNPQDVHPAGISLNAIYDYNNNANISLTPQWFSGRNQVNSYYTDSQFSLASDQLILKSDGTNSVKYFRNTLDGISVDWNLSDYQIINDINGDSNTFNNINNLNDYNSISNNGDFEYNAVLIYYDLSDINNPGNTITNLYGIQFLNQIQNTGGEFNIPFFTKYKPNLISKVSGNSLSHKFNIKGDSSYENVGVVQLLNTRTSGDYNTMSMDLFITALTGMKTMTDSYTNNLTYITNVKNELDSIKQLFITNQNQDQLSSRILILENSYNQSIDLFDNAKTYMNFIIDLNTKYNNIINNKTTIDVRYNLDPAIINNMVIHPQQFNINLSTYSGDIVSLNTLTLAQYSNYFRHVNSNIQQTTLTKSLIIKIDDSLVKWSYGQTFEIVFADKFDPSTCYVYIVTDATNILHAVSNYSKQISILSKDDFPDSNLTPIFRIMCVNPTNLEFVVDKIR